MYDTTPEHGPQQPGGRYFCAYWQHEYTVDAMYTTVHPMRDDANGAFRWIPGSTWYNVTWIPSEDAIHPRASAQWRGDGYRKGSHCTSWDARRDEIISQANGPRRPAASDARSVAGQPLRSLMDATHHTPAAAGGLLHPGRGGRGEAPRFPEGRAGHLVESRRGQGAC